MRGERVFLHLDLDVLDPSEMACTFPAPGGLSMDQLRALLAQLADAADIVGIEVTSMAAPAPAPRLAELLLPLLRALAAHAPPPVAGAEWSTSVGVVRRARRPSRRP